jgi:thiol-disulfide isomerase/thioredoxin
LVVLLGVASGSGMATVGAASDGADPAAPAAPEGDDTPAALTVDDLAGAPQSLSTLRGRVVVLNLWAEWCAPCVEEMPRLIELQRELAVLGLQVVGASADRPDVAGEVLERARELDNNSPVWIAATIEDMRRLGLFGALPGTVVLDRDGRERAVNQGS